MAKFWNNVIRNVTMKNAPSGGSATGAGAINRDPKAIRVKRVGYQLVNGAGSAGRDNFQEPIADLNLIDTAIQTDSYVMQAMMKYSELIFKSGWHLKGKNEQALEYLKLRFKVMAVATGIPTEELLQGIADDIVRYGNCFLVKARAKGGVGLPPGLSVIPVPPAREPIGGYFRLPPQTMTIARDEKGEILAYQQELDSGGDPITFKPEDIVHIAVNRPVGRPFGEPWIAPVLEDVRLLRKVEENAALLLYRHIFPLLTYTVGLDKPGYEASDEELEEVQQMIEALPADGVIILPERHKVEPVKVETIDGKPYLDYFEQRVFTGLGMSAVDMGRGNTANRNTADAMTGIKADRVKGWQKSLQAQIDEFIIDELLVEGGFDPLVNPEFDIDFVFEEIEQERKIAKENHAIQKWNSNLATFEETRVELGLDPTADESRLYVNMIGTAEAAHTAKETDNKNAPENQHGKRQGPKSKTESVQESETVYSYLNKEIIDNLYQSLSISYQDVEKDVIDMIDAHAKKQVFPVKDTKQWLGVIRFSKERMLRIVQEQTRYALSEGMTKAKEDSKRESYPEVDIGSALHVIRSHIAESLDDLENNLRKRIAEKLKEAKTREEAILSVKGIFKSSSYRLKFLSKSILAKSYNYGYALSQIKYGESYLTSVYQGDCLTCQKKSKEKIAIQELSTLEDIAIFYRIPPWHPNCECLLQLEGGED